MTLSRYIGTFCHGIVSLGAICTRPMLECAVEWFADGSCFCPVYLPVYFQACRDASPIGSGVDIFPLTLTIPVAAIIAGGSVKAVKRYCPQNYIGWVACIIGFGVLSMVTENSSRAQYIATQIPAGIGIGMVWVLTQFPILAPLPVSNSAHALGFHVFLRRFAQVSCQWRRALFYGRRPSSDRTK